MINAIPHLVQKHGIFVVLPLLFVGIGTLTLMRYIWAFLTGGPRALHEPGAPYLYDRIYYLLWILMLIGWTGFALSFLSEFATNREDNAPYAFILCWAISAGGISLLILTREAMMLRGFRYFTQHGSWIRRQFNRLQLMQFDRQPAFMRKMISGVFLIVAVILLGVVLFHIPETMSQLQNELAMLPARFT